MFCKTRRRSLYVENLVEARAPVAAPPAAVGEKMIHFDLFSGIGGFSLAVDAVWENAEHIFCEIDPYCQALLKRRFPGAKIYGDIRRFIADTASKRFCRRSENASKEQTKLSWQNNEQITSDSRSKKSGRLSNSKRQTISETRKVYLLTAGVPCQPASTAGKRRGKKDDRWLWSETFEVIRITKPRWCILENVRGLLSLEGGLVFNSLLSELETIGYEVQPFIIPACAVNAPHRRDRVWIVAHNSTSDGYRQKNKIQARRDCAIGSSSNAPDTASRLRRTEQGKQPEERAEVYERSYGNRWNQDWLEVAKYFCGMDDEFSTWLDKSFNIVINEEDYSADKKDRTEGVRILRKVIQQEDEQGERVRGLFKIPKKEVLLSFLFHIEKTSIEQSIAMEGEQDEEAKSMRDLWHDIRFASPSYKPELNQQLAQELTNIVSELPYKTASCFTEIWNYCQNSYSSMLSQAVNMDGLKLSKSRHRIERLKALGNAIVPQVAVEIMKAIKQTEASYAPKSRTMGEG